MAEPTASSTVQGHPGGNARGSAPPYAADLLHALKAKNLVALGTAPPDRAFCPPAARALVLIGTEGGSAWWDRVTASREWRDGAPDPLDRWSERILGGMARDFGGTALFPSDGPPWPPFQTWAQQTGRIWQSPVRLLIHVDAGLWLAFRGALALPFDVPLPPARNPCTTCATRACLAACPASALDAAGYDVPACRAFLDTDAGASCFSRGCAVRRACPASRNHARLPAQSAYHMSQFHP
jgi:epoxyqueuosine reductase